MTRPYGRVFYWSTGDESCIPENESDTDPMNQNARNEPLVPSEDKEAGSAIKANTGTASAHEYIRGTPGARATRDGILGKPPIAPGQRAVVRPDNDVQLPHERDQSVGSDSTQGMDGGAAGEEQQRLGKQAADDLAQGQVDTDMRATPGLDAERRDALTHPPTKSKR